MYLTTSGWKFGVMALTFIVKEAKFASVGLAAGVRAAGRSKAARQKHDAWVQRERSEDFIKYWIARSDLDAEFKELVFTKMI